MRNKRWFNIYVIFIAQFNFVTYLTDTLYSYTLLALHMSFIPFIIASCIYDIWLLLLLALLNFSQFISLKNK